MLRRSVPRRRRGVTVLECAVVYPVTFFLLLGLVIGAMGIVRYQEVAALARAGARYASTHGAQYRKDTGMGVGSAGASSGTLTNNVYWYSANPTASTGSDTSWTGLIYDNGIRPNLVALDSNYLQVQVGWPPVINQAKPDNWPGSTVTVTVTYQWLPELFLIGPINLTSSSTMPITN
jgi:Flp pilus assembly protein TadG